MSNLPALRSINPRVSGWLGCHRLPMKSPLFGWVVGFPEQVAFPLVSLKGAQKRPPLPTAHTPTVGFDLFRVSGNVSSPRIVVKRKKGNF